MDRQMALRLLCLTCLGLFLFACGGPTAISDQDRIATRVAEEEAVVATLTAKAPVPPPQTPTPTLSPTLAGQVSSDTLPTHTPTPLSSPTSVTSTDTPPPTNTPLSPQPTPIAAQPTPTPVPPPPTPTQPIYDVLEVDGDAGNPNLQGGQPLNDGRYLIIPGYAPGGIDRENPVFRDKLVFRVEVFDAARGGAKDGDGIQNVKFKIAKEDDPDNPVYEKVESTPGYCVFGGGEPNCEVWVFAQHDYRWPGGQPIENIAYRAFIEITPDTGEPAIWNWGFRIEGIPEASPPGNLVAQIVQIGPDSTSDVVNGALVFQVAAYNDTVGNNDGAGIDRVDLRIIKDGQEVYQRTEQNAAYCAFSGGEPNCNVWNFAEHGNTWPNGDPIEPGPHTLHATVYAEDGQTAIVEITIEIQLSSN